MEKLVFILLTILCCACHVSRMPDNIRTTTRFMSFKDSGEALRSFLVFTALPCDSVEFINRKGKRMLKAGEDKTQDSSCFSCDALSTEEGRGNKILNLLEFEGIAYHFWINMNGEIVVQNPYCQKGIINIRGKWKDSIPVVTWHEIKKDSGTLVFYAAEEQYAYPYYKKENMDSFRFDLRNFCSTDESNEEKKSNQEYFESTMKIQVTPNPFKDDFGLILHKDPIGIFDYECPGARLTISFYDDKGNLLISKPIEPEEHYTFSFPEIAPGKTVFYRITWEDYTLSGQVLKS